MFSLFLLQPVHRVPNVSKQQSDRTPHMQSSKDLVEKLGEIGEQLEKVSLLSAL
jgi:hypothetical protein